MKKVLITIVAIVLSACCVQAQSIKQAMNDNNKFVHQGIGQSSVQYVDLGLSVKWATCNVGAGKSWEYGGYFTFEEAQKQGQVPTEEEFQELLDKCTWQWTTLNGVNGYRVTARNGNSIFLPAAGFRYGSDVDYVGSFGLYWSSSASGNDYDAYYGLSFYSDGVYMYYGNRFDGLSVRLVLGL